MQQEFQARGLIENLSHPDLFEQLAARSMAFYCGYDPTARSLQLGNLYMIIAMKRLQQFGHRPIVVIGGATGMIGDPSFKSSERVMLDEATIDANVSAQRRQFEQLLDFDLSKSKAPAQLMNNIDWFGKFSLIEFLRDVGKRFRINEMLAKDSVRSRIDSESGLSFTEFTYQMLQAYDFAYLHKHHGVELQIGGSDQWGNITAGIDLTRKLHGRQVYGWVMPLVTDAAGKKFGKSEAGAIYLDPDMTSPYHFYQYLYNSDDSTVIRYLKYFTFLTLEQIAELDQVLQQSPHLREAQKVLARELTVMVHGEAGLASAERASKIFFGEKMENLSARDLMAIFKDVPCVELDASELWGDGAMDISSLLARTPLFKSKGEAKRAIEQKGVYTNNEVVSVWDAKIRPADFIDEKVCVVRKGKKNYAVILVTSR